MLPAALSHRISHRADTQCQAQSQGWSEMQAAVRRAAVSPWQLLRVYGNQPSAMTSLQGYTPEKLPPSSCVMAPELCAPNPAKSLFAKVTKTLFRKKKPKGECIQKPPGDPFYPWRCMSCSPGRLGVGLCVPLPGVSTCWLVPALPLLVACWGVHPVSRQHAATHWAVPPGQPMPRENGEVKVGDGSLTPSSPHGLCCGEGWPRCPCSL